MNSYKIITILLTLISIGLIIWSCTIKSTDLSEIQSTRYLVILSMTTAFSIIRWVRYYYDWDIIDKYRNKK